jgi:hypothetical protein
MQDISLLKINLRKALFISVIAAVIIEALMQRNSEALYICKKCNNLFTQRIPTENELCEKCLAK